MAARDAGRMRLRCAPGTSPVEYEVSGRPRQLRTTECFNRRSSQSSRLISFGATASERETTSARHRASRRLRSGFLGGMPESWMAARRAVNSARTAAGGLLGNVSIARLPTTVSATETLAGDNALSLNRCQLASNLTLRTANPHRVRPSGAAVAASMRCISMLVNARYSKVRTGSRWSTMRCAFGFRTASISPTVRL